MALPPGDSPLCNNNITQHLLSVAEEKEKIEVSYESSHGCVGLKKFFKVVGNTIYFLFQPALTFLKKDLRKVIFSLKMATTLALVSLMMFMDGPFEEISIHCLWAILTVVVVFEFTIGATLSKGFNRALGSLTAGGLALGVAELSVCTGNFESVVIVLSIFVVGSGATFAKLYPKVKQYEYGFRVFLLTYCLILVSGYKNMDFLHTAATRFFLIAVGATIALLINACIFPNWAGEDLHNMIVQNFMGVADSLEGCIQAYLSGREIEHTSSKILTHQESEDPLHSGYMSAVISAKQEETLEGFASWEPPHGRYKMIRYPWNKFVKVGGALRHCAYMVVALHGCLLSEIQAPHELRKAFSIDLQRVSFEGAKVLREMGDNIKNMKKFRHGDILHDVHVAAEELQKKIDTHSYLLINLESWRTGNRCEIPSNIRTDQTESKVQDQMGNCMRSDNELAFSLLSNSWNCSTSPSCLKSVTAANNPEAKICKHCSWLSRVADNLSHIDSKKELRTYESASALSLATFASLLIEFVARLDNLMNAFEELSTCAKFKQPDENI